MCWPSSKQQAAGNVAFGARERGPDGPRLGPLGQDEVSADSGVVEGDLHRASHHHGHLRELSADAACAKSRTHRKGNAD